MYGRQNTAKLWHQHEGNLREGMNFTPLLTDPDCYGDCVVDVDVFVHVHDGLLLRPSLEVQPSTEHLSTQVLMSTVRRLEHLNDQMFFPGRGHVRTAPVGGGKSEVHPRSGCLAGFFRREAGTGDRNPDRAGRRKPSSTQNGSGQVAVHVPRKSQREVERPREN